MLERQGVVTSAALDGVSRQGSEPKIVVQVFDRILNEVVTRLDCDHADRCGKFRAIPGKELEAVVRVCIIHIGSITWLRKVGAVCETPGGRRSATTARAL